MDIWVVCAFWLLLIMVLWKFMYKLFKWIFSVLLSVYLGVELLGHIYCMFNFWKNCQIVFHRWCTILHSYLQFMRAEFHTFSPICFFPSYTTTLMMSVGIPGGSVVKNLPAVQEMWVWSLGWEDPLEEGNGYPLQYSGLENPMDCVLHWSCKESDITERLSLNC